MNENEQTNKPIKGTWDNMNVDRLPKVEFDFDKSIEMTIDCDEPREIEYDDSVFYVFSVIHEGEQKEISTSAWSLLKGLKACYPLKGRRIRITKKIIKGKQHYVVENLDEAKEEDVKDNAI